ncbi:hypothetical protein QTN25_001771 [Entamoeba marina]
MYCSIQNTCYKKTNAKEEYQELPWLLTQIIKSDSNLNEMLKETGNIKVYLKHIEELDIQYLKVILMIIRTCLNESTIKDMVNYEFVEKSKYLLLLKDGDIQQNTMMILTLCLENEEFKRDV